MGEELPQKTWWKFDLKRSAAIVAGIALSRSGAAAAAFRTVKGWLGFGDQASEATGGANRPIADTVGMSSSPSHGDYQNPVSVPVTPVPPMMPRTR